MLISMDGQRGSNTQPMSMFSKVKGSIKHLLGRGGKGEPVRKIERYSNKHFREALKTEFFKERTLIIHIYIIFGFFLLGILIFIIVFCLEGCKKKEGTNDEGKQYSELVNQGPQN